VKTAGGWGRTLGEAPQDIIQENRKAQREKTFLRYLFPIAESALHVAAIMIFVTEVFEHLIPDPVLIYKVQMHIVPSLMVEIVELENPSNAPLFPLKGIWTIDPPNPSILLQADPTAPPSEITTTPKTRVLTLTEQIFNKIYVAVVQAILLVELAREFVVPNAAFSAYVLLVNIIMFAMMLLSYVLIVPRFARACIA
jgi:hypothetical protein